MTINDEQRLKSEIEHGKFICKAWTGTLWYWETPAGRIRWSRRLRMLTSHISAGMKVLEIGCAVGYFTKHIAELKADVVAIDISPDLIKIARDNVKQSNVRFQVANAYDLTFEGESFDSIVGSSILHHLDVDKALKEFYRVLRPGGTILFTEPNMLNPQIFLERKVPFVGKMVGAIPHEIAFMRKRLEKQIASYGFKDIEVMPFDFLHPLTPKFLNFFVERIGNMFEKIPFIREIAGSLYIKARKA